MENGIKVIFVGGWIPAQSELKRSLKPEMTPGSEMVTRVSQRRGLLHLQ